MFGILCLFLLNTCILTLYNKKVVKTKSANKVINELIIIDLITMKFVKRLDNKFN